MPFVQMQIIRRYHGGSEAVIYSQDVDLRNHQEYDEAIRRLDRRCGDSDFTRTVGEGSPLALRGSWAINEDEEEES